MKRRANVTSEATMNVIDSVEIHNLIRHHCHELEVSDSSLGILGDDILSEEILTDGSREIARTYRLGGLIAMWYVDAGVLQFFDLQAKLLHSVAYP